MRICLRRRDFIAGLGGAAAPLAARAQQGRPGAAHRRAHVGRGKRFSTEDFRFCVPSSACGPGLDRWPQRAVGPPVERH